MQILSLGERERRCRFVFSTRIMSWKRRKTKGEDGLRVGIVKLLIIVSC
jgi:hypothetical protein